MKKLLIISTIALGLTGCYKCVDDTNVADPWTYHGNICQTKVVNIEKPQVHHHGWQLLWQHHPC